MFANLADPDLIVRMGEEYQAHERLGQPSIMIRFGAYQLLSIVANLQLALRHPDNSGAASAMCRDFVGQTIEMLETHGWPVMAEAMRRGNNPAHDTFC